MPIAKTEQAAHPKHGAYSIQFEVVLVSPAVEGGWFLLGEPSKWVSVSSQRFSEVKTSAAGGASVKVAGAAPRPCIAQWGEHRLCVLDRHYAGDMHRR